MSKYLDYAVMALLLAVGVSVVMHNSHAQAPTPGSQLNQGASGQVGQGWLVKCDEPADTNGTLTTVGDTVTELNLDGYATVLMTAKGTYAGATWVIEFSDDSGANWFPSLGSRMDLPVRESGGTNLTNISRGWVINPGPGADSVRVRLIAITSGSVQIHISSNSCASTHGVTSSIDPYNFSNINTSTTTLVKTGSGILHSVTVNSLGTVASKANMFDSLVGSGVTIAGLNTLSVLGTVTYDLQFNNGLTIVTTGTVAPDITVSYR